MSDTSPARIDKHVNAAQSLDRFFDVTLPGLIWPPAIDASPEYREALEFKEVAEAKPDKDYGWVCEYAPGVYDRLMKTRDALDDKASDVIKYLGGGAGLFTLVAILNVTPKNLHILWWALPSFLATITSVFLAVLARQPSETKFPPSIRAAMEYVEFFDDTDKVVAREKAVAAFLGQWHAACVGMEVVNALKAARVGAAIWAFFAAIVLLGLPFGVALTG